MSGQEGSEKDSDALWRRIEFDNCYEFGKSHQIAVQSFEPSMDAREIHDKLASDNIRIFAVRLMVNGKPEVQHWIHSNKTVSQWRDDMRYFVASSRRNCEEGWACSEVWNALYTHLHSLGYQEIDDVVADVYEGRITNNSAMLVDDPDHEEQKDGFGHYGWESK